MSEQNLMKSLIESVDKKRLEEANFVEKEVLEKVENNLSSLESLIKRKLGFSPSLKVKMNRSNKVEIYSDEDLSSQLGRTLVKTLFEKIHIRWWGGDINLERGTVWFNPQVSYSHPSGGSNGTQFIWDSIWFDIEAEKWVEGRVIF